MHTSGERLIVVGILCIAVFVRLYRIDLTWYFLDHVRDVSTAIAIASAKAFPLVGPLIGWTSGRLGPLYFYLIAPPFAITHDPIAGFVFVALVNVLAVFLCYRFAHLYFGTPVALVASALFAVFPLGVFSSRVLWNPALVPLFTLLFMRALFAVVVAGRSRAIIGLFASLAILTQIHLTTAALGVVAFSRSWCGDLGCGPSTWLAGLGGFGCFTLRISGTSCPIASRTCGRFCSESVPRRPGPASEPCEPGVQSPGPLPAGDRRLRRRGSLAPVLSRCVLVPLPDRGAPLLRRSGALPLAARPRPECHDTSRDRTAQVHRAAPPLAGGSRGAARHQAHRALVVLLRSPLPEPVHFRRHCPCALASVTVIPARAGGRWPGQRRVVLAVIVSQAWFQVGLQQRIERQGQLVFDVPKFSVASAGSSLGILPSLPYDYRPAAPDARGGLRDAAGCIRSSCPRTGPRASR